MFSKTAIFYISKANILAVAKNIPVQKLEIKTFVINQEVVNTVSFIKSLSAFLNNLKLKDYKALVAIDESLTFNSPPNDKKITQQEIDDFTQALPFDNKVLEITIIKKEGENILVATNKTIYGSLIKALEQTSNEAEIVFPAKYVPISEIDIETLSFNELHAKLTANTNLGDINFKTEKAKIPKIEHNQAENTPNIKDQANDQKSAEVIGDTSQPEVKKRPTFSKYILIVFLLFVIFASLVFAFFKLQKTKVKSAPLQSQSISAPQEASQEPELKQLTKEEITISIQNGSGKAGQAAKVKDILEKVGFLNIDVTNSQEKVDSTQIAFSPEVPTNIQSEISTQLKEIFKNVEVLQMENLQTNVKITTGD